MPEAPEVERVLRTLVPVVMNTTIDRHLSLHFCFPTIPRITIRSMHRHGKWMVLSDRVNAVMINLGMSGGFAVHGPLKRNMRWCAMLQGEQERTLLQFIDPRCMGRLKYLDRSQTRFIMSDTARSRGCPELGLGPDAMGRAMSDPDQLRVTNKWRTLLNVSFELKRALMMQHIVAGLGNIYAAEACWYARASPWRAAHTLSRAQVSALALEVPKMLQRSFRLGGTSIGDANSFRGMDGAEGNASSILRVYGRAGLPCRRCGNLITSAKQHGRTTFWCSGCQL